MMLGPPVFTSWQGGDPGTTDPIELQIAAGGNLVLVQEIHEPLKAATANGFLSMRQSPAREVTYFQRAASNCRYREATRGYRKYYFSTGWTLRPDAPTRLFIWFQFLN